MATEVGIEELLEAGVHFGHQTRRWNPKMRRFIHGERGGIYIIDLLQTQRLLEQAQDFASELAHRGGTILFVGTKKQARDAIKEVAESAGMPYVNHRWLGGLLTNFQTINLRIRRLHDLERYETEGQLELLPTRERMAAQADLAKLRAQPRRRQEHAARAGRRCSSSTSRPRRSPCARPSACASRSSAWSTPTATRTASTSSSPATTTRSAPATSSPARSATRSPRALRCSAPRRSARARRPRRRPRRAGRGARPRARPRSRPRREAAEQARRRGRGRRDRRGGRGRPRRRRGRGRAGAARSSGAPQPSPDAAVPRARSRAAARRRRPRGRRPRRARAAARLDPTPDAGEPAGERGRRGDARPRRPTPRRSRPPPSRRPRRRRRRAADRRREPRRAAQTPTEEQNA